MCVPRVVVHFKKNVTKEAKAPESMAVKIGREKETDNAFGPKNGLLQEHKKLDSSHMKSLHYAEGFS